jgi:putative nucleotidyltransferase with HDIG domain/PAS domain S-box-containing protein
MKKETEKLMSLCRDYILSSDLNNKSVVQKILDSVPFYVLIIDSNHKILLANAAVQKYLGFNPEDIIGHYCPKVIHGMDTPFPGCPLEESLKTGRSIEKEIYYEEYDKWVLSCIYKTGLYTDENNELFLHMISDITQQKQNHQKLQKTLEDTIKTLASIVEIKDLYTAGHQKRVAKLSVAIAIKLGLSKEKINMVKTAALLHDIGKIVIPASILTKPSTLSNIEMSLIETHSQVGYDFLKEIDFGYPVANIILQHHERIDGSGYPNGLKKDDIMLESEIIIVADVVEAMTFLRPYRPALGIDKALQEIEDNKGILYDFDIVDACIKLFKEDNFDFD